MSFHRYVRRLLLDYHNAWTADDWARERDYALTVLRSEVASRVRSKVGS